MSELNSFELIWLLGMPVAFIVGLIVCGVQARKEARKWRQRHSDYFDYTGRQLKDKPPRYDQAMGYVTISLGAAFIWPLIAGLALAVAGSIVVVSPFWLFFDRFAHAGTPPTEGDES